MWIRNKKSGTYWFAAHNELMSSSDDLNNYFLTGIALGLCVYNGVLLDIDFPNILYKKLLSEPIGLPDLKDLMPSEYDGLMKLLQYDKDDIEDVFCLNFEVTVKDFGSVSSRRIRLYTPRPRQWSSRALKPPGAYIRIGGPSPTTSYRVRIPSMSVKGMSIGFFP